MGFVLKHADLGLYLLQKSMDAGYAGQELRKNINLVAAILKVVITTLLMQT